ATASDSRPQLPVLPLRDVVVFPHMVIPLFVGREKSVKALEQAMAGDKRIILVAQRSPELDDPGEKDLFEIGTVAQILQLLNLPDGTLKVLVEGAERIRIADYGDRDGALVASGETLASFSDRDDRELDVTLRSLLGQF